MSIHVLKVDQEDNSQRLDVFLAQKLTDIPSRTFVRKLIDNGHVKVNEESVKANHKLRTGEQIFIDIPKDLNRPQYVEPENVKLDIVYEDESIIVVNKPSGMLVHPAQGIYEKTLVNALLHYSKNLSDFNTDMRPGIVHRLDQETSGLLLIAKDNIVHTKLAKQFQRRTIKKCYVALVEGNVEFEEGKIEVPIGRDRSHRDKKAVQFDDSSKDSTTFYKVIKRAKNATLVYLYPKTGRTHQLRVHMAYIKHPVLGDKKYGRKNSFFRLALHAKAIAFTHPVTKSFMEVSIPAPAEFLKIL